MNSITLHDIDDIKQESSHHSKGSGGAFTVIRMTLTDTKWNEFFVNVFPTDALAQKLRSNVPAEATKP